MKAGIWLHLPSTVLLSVGSSHSIRATASSLSHLPGAVLLGMLKNKRRHAGGILSPPSLPPSLTHTPMHAQTQGQEAGSCAGGILSQSWQAQTLELETRLAASRATWKLVVGHHPIWNNHFNHTQELVDSVQPLLERCCACIHSRKGQVQTVVCAECRASSGSLECPLTGLMAHTAA